jgi:hypothetical protein
MEKPTIVQIQSVLHVAETLSDIAKDDVMDYAEIKLYLGLMNEHQRKELLLRLITTTLNYSGELLNEVQK